MDLISIIVPVYNVEKYLEQKFPGKIAVVYGTVSAALADSIEANFDASYKKTQQNKFQILLATDKMSEGHNLNRAGLVINYDIPWNPTRVIQRVGRINRIGKKVFQQLYIFRGIEVTFALVIVDEKACIYRF